MSEPARDDSPIDAPLSDGRPLHAHAAMAIMEGDLARLRFLVESIPEEAVDELFHCNRWENNFTLLMLACASPSPNRLDVVRYIVKDLKADPNDNGCDGSPEDYQCSDAPSCVAPLHLAAGSGGEDGVPLVRFLVESGAEVWQIDRNGSTPFHTACVTGNLAAVRYFVEESGMSAEPYGLVMCLNHADMFGGTGLSWAAREGHKDLVRYLVSKGADKNKRDNEGKGPIDYAREGGEECKSILSILQQS